MLIEKSIGAIIFGILMLIFTTCYWSFFPGGYTPDSYFSYLNALGINDYREVVSPPYVIYWKLLNNYNFGPFLINYLVFIVSLVLSVKFTRSYYIAIFSLIGICLPYTLITYIFVWKDTALLSVMFLAVILCLNKNKSAAAVSVTILILFIAFLLRVNAAFAVTPLLFYIVRQQFNILKAVALTGVIILGFHFANKGINKFVFQAESGNVEQTMMFTDIAKINYLQKTNVAEDIPEEYVDPSNLSDENVNKMFQLYCDFSCNDILYMYPEWQGAKSFLHNDPREEPAVRLRNNWLYKIVKNPLAYLRVRLSQLNNALWSNRLLYSPEVIEFNDELFNRMAFGNEKTREINRSNKVFSPASNSLTMGIRIFFGQKRELLEIISYPGVYLIFSIIMFVAFSVQRKVNNFYKFGVYLSASGILYTLAYVPLLPCTDYRYFIWSIFSFWVSMGVFALARLKTNEALDIKKN